MYAVIRGKNWARWVLVVLVLVTLVLSVYSVLQRPLPIPLYMTLYLVILLYGLLLSTSVKACLHVRKQTQHKDPRSMLRRRRERRRITSWCWSRRMCFMARQHASQSLHLTRPRRDPGEALCPGELSSLGFSDKHYAVLGITSRYLINCVWPLHSAA